MSVDIHAILRDPLLLLATLIGLIVVKAIVVVLLTKVFGLSWLSAIEAGLLLGPGGEFAFVGITQAASLRVLDQEHANFALVLTAVSLTIIPLLSGIAQKIRRTFDPASAHPQLSARPPVVDRRAIVVGYGRVGTVVCELLHHHGIDFVAIDRSPQTVMRARQSHPEVYYGNAADAEFLKLCGIGTAPGVIITVDVPDDLNNIVATVRRLRPDIPIVARARDAAHARQLYSAAVTDAVPETIEASLQVSEAALVMLGVPMGPAIASIHQKRDDFRRELQDAAAAVRPSKPPTWLRKKRV
jgi:CPA2 family monovalent cation:H+ antiporter-2